MTTTAWKSIRALDMEVRTERKISLKTRICRGLLGLWFTAWLALGGFGFYTLDGLKSGLQPRGVLIFCAAITVATMYAFFRFLTWRREA